MNGDGFEYTNYKLKSKYLKGAINMNNQFTKLSEDETKITFFMSNNTEIVVDTDRWQYSFYHDEYYYYEVGESLFFKTKALHDSENIQISERNFMNISLEQQYEY